MPPFFRSKSTSKKEKAASTSKSFSVPSRDRIDSAQTRQSTISQDSAYVAPRAVSYTEFGGLKVHPDPPAPEGMPVASSSAHPPILLPKYTFASTRLPSLTAANLVDSFAYSHDGATHNRQYGLLGGIGAKVTLSLEEVSTVIKVVGGELERRALATPLLFSNQALELSPARVRALIQSYMDVLRSASEAKRATWEHDLAFAKEQELAWLLRWVLSRIQRVKESTKEVEHGVMEWEVYEEWRGRERAAGYPQAAYPYLAAVVPAEVYHIIVTPLLSLLSRFAAHSHLSGLTPHTLSSLFAAFLFDVPTSTPCTQSHAAFVRAACATEHLLLAYIRWSGQGEGLGVTDLPGRLKDWVSGYPSMVASDADLARAIPRRGARTIRCERISRVVRAYSRDIITTAELWSKDTTDWTAWDRVVLRSKRGEAGRPKFSNAWKRRLAVKDDLSLPSSAASLRQTGYGSASKSALASKRHTGRQPSEDGSEALWGSLAGKEWSMFEEGGFDASNSSGKGRDDMRSRLQFDLNESAKMSVTQKRQTMEWTDFAAESGGFTRTDPVLDVSLSFASPLSDSINEWPKERDDLNRRLHKSQKESTPFDYDTKPKLGLDVMDDLARPDGAGRVFLEEAFVDWWADWGIGGGWVEREELTFKEANWALIEYRARPSRPDEPSAGDSLADPRTTDLYFLFEEKVPLIAIANPAEKRTLATLFNSRKKRNNTVTKPRVGSGCEDSDFDRMLLHRGKTKKITAGPRIDSQASVWRMSQDSQSPKTPNSPKSPVRVSAVAPTLFHSKSRNWRRGDETDKIAPEVNMSGGKASFFSKNKDKVVRRVKTEEGARERNKKYSEQREKEVEFDFHSASGLSSPDTSPKDGVKKADEKWMHVLVANGARRMDRQDAEVPKPRPAATASTTSADSGPPIGTSSRVQHATHMPVKAPVELGAPILSTSASGQVSSSPRYTVQNTADAHHDDTSPANLGLTHSPETSGSDIEAVTPKGPDIVRWGSGRRKPVPVLDHNRGQHPEAGLEDDGHSHGRMSYDSERSNKSEAPIPPLKDRPSLEVLSPRPQRDTIHSLVDTYGDSGSDGEEDERPVYRDPNDAIRYKYQLGASDTRRSSTGYAGMAGLLGLPVTSAIPAVPAVPALPATSTKPNKAGAAGPLGYSAFGTHESVDDPTRGGVGSGQSETNLTPPKLGPVFDLTPGREPSPARYKHGEPLQFVGEESEEE